MNNWRAKPSVGGALGIALTGFALAVFGLLLWLTLNFALESYDDDPHYGANLGTFGLALATCAAALVVALLAYRTWRFFQTHYYLDRNAIKIELGGKQQIIPLANVRQVLPADTLLESLRQEAYGGEKPPEAGRRDDGVRVRTFSQPRSTTTTTAHRVETATEAADSSLDEQIGSEVVEVEGEVLKTEFDDGITAADGGRPENLSSSQPISDNSSQNNLGKPPEKKAAPVPGFVAFKVKTKLLTSWPGFYTNQGWLASLGEIQFYSTQPFPKTLLVRTTNTTYAISPADPQQFMTEYKLRRNLGAIESVEEEVVRGKFLTHPLWHDWLGRGLILLGVVINLALFAFLLSRFADFPPIIRMHYNKFGVVDRLESSISILWLPLIGLLTAFTNSILGTWLHPRERVPALLLYGSIIAIQIMTWIATIGILATSGAS